MHANRVTPAHRWLLAISMLPLLLAAPPVSAAPAWRLNTASNTTAFPGGTITYHILDVNVGTTTTSGSTITTITLPTGLTAVSAFRFIGLGFAMPDCTGEDGVSPVAGASTVKCTMTSPLAASRDLRYKLVTSVDPAMTSPRTLTSSFSVTGGGASTDASTVDPTRIDDPPGFGIDAFDGQFVGDAAGDATTQAGGHPYAVSTSVDFNTVTNPFSQLGDLWPVEPVRDAIVDLSPGFVGSIAGVDQCTTAQLTNGFGTTARPLCPATSQVGTTFVRLNGFGTFPSIFGPVPVFSMTPPPDSPAKFGFNVAGTIVTLTARLRSNGDYGISIDGRDLSEGLPIAGTTVTFWGVPSDPSHNLERACPGEIFPRSGGPSCPSGAPPRAFLRTPTSCEGQGGGVATNLSVDSWNHPGVQDANGAPVASDPNWKHATWVTHDSPGYPYPPSDFGPNLLPTGCDKVPFTPTFDLRPATSSVRANTPTPFAVDVTLPQTDDPNTIAESDLKKSVVTLPAGVRVSPSSADGLAACSPAQIGLDSTSDAHCPDASKVATMTIETPLLKESLTGSVYLATPHDNPFHSLIAIYLVAKGPGVVVKLAGNVTPDPSTGQITTTVESPQVPFSKLHLEFKGGSRAPLTTPASCGTYTTHAELTPWARPDSPVTSDSSFTVDHNSDGSPCAPAGFSPGFSAGTINPRAGASSPFVLRLTRGDNDQELSSIAVDTPTGLLAKVANVTLCPDAAAAAGTCQDVSKVGSVTVGAGAGPDPFFIQTGRAYLTGPYKGAPLGLAIVVPAVAGPFDLGNVVVRSKIDVDRATAQVHVISDPLPTILDGIPLGVRDVRVSADKPDFFVNPTNCAAKHVAATVGSTQGAIAHVSTHFQMLNCSSLALAPKLSLTVGARRHTRPGVSTPVTAVVTMPPGGSNLRSTSVTLPSSLNALLPVVNRACKLAEFNAGHCGNKAKAGSVSVVSPLLRDPLRGSAFFVKNPARVLPDLMFALHGLIDLNVTAKVSIPGGKRLATRFDTIPDAPLTKLVLRIPSGKNDPLGIATDLCSAKGRSATAAVAFRGQNGALVKVNQHVRVNGCAKRARSGRTTRRR